MVFYCNFQQITNCRMLFCCCPNCDFDLEMQNWYRGCCYFNGMVKLMRSQSIWSDLYMLSRNLLMTGVMLAGQLWFFFFSFLAEDFLSMYVLVVLQVLWVFHWLCFEGFFSSVRWGFSREFGKAGSIFLLLSIFLDLFTVFTMFSANGALSAEARLAKVKVDADFIAPCDTSILYPTDGGNMHCFTVVTQCAVLDVLGPPYNDAEGRHCAYYIEHPLDHISGIYSLFLG